MAPRLAPSSSQSATKMKPVIVKKEVLLVEIVRYCPLCNLKNSIAITRKEVQSFKGFECCHCKGWVEDTLSQTDIPEWWPEEDTGGNIS
jgi:hypothetical protein